MFHHVFYSLHLKPVCGPSQGKPGGALQGIQFATARASVPQFIWQQSASPISHKSLNNLKSNTEVSHQCFVVRLQKRKHWWPPHFSPCFVKLIFTPTLWPHTEVVILLYRQIYLKRSWFWFWIAKISSMSLSGHRRPSLTDLLPPGETGDNNKA